MELIINDATQTIASPSEVSARLRATSNAVHREIWLTASNGAALCALMNGDRGWLMFLRENGDAGLSSRNPNYRGSPDATIEYLLSNGEVNTHPAEWALTYFEIVRALEHFVEHETLPSFIRWHDDST
jgi:hypothetical protein